MPPKPKITPKQKPQEDQREETLQAVILTDSFEDRFAPFTLEKPRCLLPVANVPLIEYTLEFLANSGIKDIFLYAGSHEDQVEEYINNSRWMYSTSPFSSLTLLRCPSTSAGDALRDLDKRDLITGDFVLVAGDIIANIDIDSALAQHRARREKDKNAIMTMLLRETGKDCRSKPTSRKPFFFINPAQDRCLHYEEISTKSRGDRRFHLDDDLLAKAEIDIRGDLLDCYIDICTPDVLGLWTDNFDYKSVRSSFLKGVLQDYELNGKTIHTHVVDEGYIARVSSLRTYDAITQDIIDRWSFPFTPDCNLLPDHNYALGKNKIYTESGIVLARGSSVTTRSIVGKDTSVGDRSVISHSVLGRRCQIGKNVKIEGSYIWDDVVIGDNSVVTGAVIANEVVVGSDCVVGKGSLLSYRVRMSKGITIPPKTRLTNTQDEFSTSKPIPPSPSLVGNGGAGYAYEPDSDASETSNALISSTTRRLSNESLESMSTLHSDPESDFDQDEEDLQSLTTSPTEDNRGSKVFLNEAMTSVQDGILKGDDPDTIKLELLGQRLTQNATDTDTRDAIARALIRCVFTFMKAPTLASTNASSESLLSSSPSAGLHGSAPSISPQQGLTAQAATTKVYQTYSPVLVQLGLFDAELPEKSDQVAVLRIIEQECANQSKSGQEVLLFALNELHRNLEVLQDEGVLQWWDGGVEGEADDTNDGDADTAVKIKPHGMEVRKLAKTYVDYLLESDEETDSEEEEEEEDDSE